MSGCNDTGQGKAGQGRGGGSVDATPPSKCSSVKRQAPD